MAKCVACAVPIGDEDAARLLSYLPARWRAHLAAFGTRGPSRMATAAGAPPAVDWGVVDVAVLLPTTDAMAQNNLELAAAMARAVNDWQAAEWLAGESRLRGSIVVAHEDAELAIDEIERRADDRRFVQVVLPAIGRAPLGDRRYWPLLAAAELHGLPICLTGAPTPHLASLVFNGIFERLMKLRIVSIGSGCGWLPSLIWRMDGSWKLLKEEVPELTRTPSEYLRDRLWFDSNEYDAPHLSSILAHLGYHDRVVAAGAPPAGADVDLLRRNALALHANRL